MKLIAIFIPSALIFLISSISEFRKLRTFNSKYDWVLFLLFAVCLCLLGSLSVIGMRFLIDSLHAE